MANGKNVKTTKIKKEQSFISWFLSQGVGVVYTVLLSMSIGIVKWLIIIILFLITWWESVR